jgi:hypothetical protein
MKIPTILSFAVVLSGISVIALAAKPIAPVAPWSPRADKMMATWSKLSHKHLTKESELKQICPFPSEQQVGIKAYPGSLVVDWQHGGGSAANSDDVPRVELATKAPLKTVIAWYKSHYPNLKAKRMFETAGPGISFSSTSSTELKHAPAWAAVAMEGGSFGGCSGLIAVPKGAGYQTGIFIYYKP